MNKMSNNKKNKYANVNKSISRDMKYKADKMCKNIINILKSKSIENWKIIVGILILIILFISMCTLKNGEEKIDITKYPKNNFRGNDFVTNVYPIFDDVVIIGDSYSYFLTMDVGFDLKTFAHPGLKLSELRNVFDSALKTKEKYAVIFIGPNDLMSQTSIDTFKELMTKYVKELKEKNKTVFIVTYLKSEYTDEAKKKFEYAITVEDYDEAIQEVCRDESVTYIDAKDINDYHNNKRMEYGGMMDSLHFNQEFNIKLINRIYEYIYDMLTIKR